MEKLTVDVVYGTGLFEAAMDLDMIGEVSAETEVILEAFKENPEFPELMRSPSLSGDDKKDVLLKVFEGKISTPTLNFLCILVDKGRIGRLRAIVKAFEDLTDERNGITKGDIYSAIPLSEEQLKKFEEETGRLLHKNVRLISILDKSIIGGVRIYVDGKVIDASVKNRLENLKQSLLKN
jgi:ATP synthase F1 delta subunit